MKIQKLFVNHKPQPVKLNPWVKGYSIYFKTGLGWASRGTILPIAWWKYASSYDLYAKISAVPFDNSLKLFIQLETFLKLG